MFFVDTGMESLGAGGLTVAGPLRFYALVVWANYGVEGLAGSLCWRRENESESGGIISVFSAFYG